MATLAQIRQALDNPNTRKMLDLIASSEGVKHGYNTLFGNQQFSNLSAHPNQRKEFTQTDGSKNYTTAAGRYQFINGTWQNLAKRYGFRSFSPMEQDLGAVALIAGRGALDDVLKGNFNSAISKLGQEWASLPSSKYKQGKRSWDFVNKQLGVRASGDQPQRTAFSGENWSDFTKQNVPQERTPNMGENWNQFTSQPQSEINTPQRTAFSDINWTDFTNQGG